MSDLAAASAALDAIDLVVQGGTGQLIANPDQQSLAYDLAHIASAAAAGRAMLTYGAHGPVEESLAVAFVGDVAHDVKQRVLGREAMWNTSVETLNALDELITHGRDPEVMAALATTTGPKHLDPDFALVDATFARFAANVIAPVAEHVHRTNADVPEEVISGLAELGAFGLSVPEEYGGGATGGEADYLAMVIATEALSAASLGIGGSLITRPEILTRALVTGGTEEQKAKWLPALASGETMAAVAVTEPDYGSDVAGLRFAARPDPAGGYRLSGTKTWCTFGARANVLMLLARTDPETTNHKGLSLFVVEKEQTVGEGFNFEQSDGARMQGRAIDTIGYRGMHSYEIAFDNWWVPDEALIGGAGGIGQGFYYQMGGFENGRLQTAARAIGVMQAAYEAAVQYSQDRVVFGEPIADYELTRVKLGRMAVLIQAARQFAYQVAHLMGSGEGSLEASMVKAYVCRAAEWVTREAMQIHGGMGYAEEYVVSRLFVDARVLSIFEGTDETLCLKVIARRLTSS